MRRGVLNEVIAVVLGLLTAQFGRAQGSVTYVSNVGQASAGSIPVGSDSWLAASFATGPNTGGYLLNSIELTMNDGSGNPDGFTVMIYSSAGPLNFIPSSPLATLTGSANPSSAGDYLFTPGSGLSLSGTTAYFVVLTSTTPVATGAYQWSYAGAYNYNSTGGWQAPIVFGADDNYQSSNGSSWNLLGGPPQFAINATAAPEPGAVILLAVGGLLIGVKQWNEKKRS